MPDFTKFWDRIYLFGPNPINMSRSDVVFFWVSIAFIVAAVVFKVFVLQQNRSNPKRYLLNRFFHLFLTIGILVLLWAGLRFENIPWLGTHIVVLAIFLIGLIWGLFIIWFMMRKYQAAKKTWHDEEERNRYLPK